MALTFADKKQVVSEVAAVAAEAHSVVTAEYNGLSAGEMTDLREKARDGGVYLRVVKNNLAKLAVKDTDFECMQGSFSGPLIMAFSQEDPGAAARVVKDFSKEHDKLVPKAVSIGGEMLDVSDLERLAKMPTRDQALAILAGTLRAPLDKLARTINEVPGKLVRTVAAIRDQKEANA